MARKVEKSSVDPRLIQMRDIQFRNTTPLSLSLTPVEKLQHDTIHRAWQLHLRKSREARQMELSRQWQRMSLACSDLQVHDLRLFKGAMIKDKKRRFPIDAKLTTDSPSGRGWDYDWKAPET